MNKTSRWIILGFALFSLVGFFDATFLTIEHYRNAILPCYVFTGCDRVTNSSYAFVLGLPVALFGAIYYLVSLISAILYFDTKSRKALRVVLNLPILGFLATLWFLFLQLFVIKSVCFYCVISAVTSVLLFILAISLKRAMKAQAH